MRRTQLALLIASAMLLTHHAQALDLLQAFGAVSYTHLTLPTTERV